MIKLTVPRSATWILPAVLTVSSTSSMGAETAFARTRLDRLAPGSRLLLHRSRFEGVSILPAGMVLGWSGDRALGFKPEIDPSTNRPESLMSVTQDLENEIRSNRLKRGIGAYDEEALIELREAAADAATCADTERKPGIEAYSTLDGYRDDFVDCGSTGATWLARLKAVKAKLMKKADATAEVEALYFRALKFHSTHFGKDRIQAMRQRCVLKFKSAVLGGAGAKSPTMPFESETRSLELGKVSTSGGASRIAVKGDRYVDSLVCDSVASVGELYELFETSTGLAVVPGVSAEKVAGAE